MAWWSDLAEWRGPSPNTGGRMKEHRGCVVHIAEGYYEGTISWQKNPDSDVSSHFIVGRDGRIAQMVDTDQTAWTQKAGNGKWLSIENEGFTPASKHYINGWETLTPQQIEANAKLLARGHVEYGYPLQMAYDPNGFGLGHHSMGCNWPGGAWGHCDCPGDPIIAQKQQILDRAKQITGEDMNDHERMMLSNAYQAQYGALTGQDPIPFIFDIDTQSPTYGQHITLPNLPLRKLNQIHEDIKALAEGLPISDEQLANVLRSMICGQ